MSERIAWQVERHFGRFGEVEHHDDGSITLRTDYANGRQVASFVLPLGEHAEVEGPAELVAEVAERVERLVAGHSNEPELAKQVKGRASLDEDDAADVPGRREAGSGPSASPGW